MFTRLFFRRREGGKPEGRGRFTLLARLVRTRPSGLDPLSSTERPVESFEATWRVSVKKRTLLLVCVLVAWGIGIQARLVNLQVFQHDRLSELASERQHYIAKTEALRGDIVDRNGQMLAYTVGADAIVADPTKVIDKAATAAAICGALGDCTRKEQAELTSRLGGKGRFTVVRQSRAVTPAQSDRVAELKLPGIALQGNTRRYYPGVDLGAHVIGFVGRDNDGQAGIEYAHDKIVRGQDGRAWVQVDAKRTRLETRVDREPVAGATLELTIDLRLQYLVERELAAGVAANRAKGGTAIVMDPYTGEVLALASYPTFNPNIAGTFSDDERRNRAVQDVYEPGSTFKLVTAAAALEEGLFAPGEIIDCSPGFIKFEGRKPITEAGGHNYGQLTFEDVIVKSSNVGAIKIGARVGIERLSRYVHRFGFGQILSSDLVGQSRGLWNPDGLDHSGLASVSMGYQVGVTPLQMASAASVIANGGLLMEPHLVRAVIRDGVREQVEPKVIRRTISANTAATLTTIMEGVTERGTAKAARLERYQVAGKTGTASKAVAGGYSKSDYNASFVGFVPSRKPVFTVLVVIDTPRALGHYGGVVAAPIVKRITEAALQHVGVPPTIDAAPPVMIATGDTHLPAPAVRPPALIATLTSEGGPALMPDVRGLSAREAVRVLGNVGMSVRLSGSGFVTAQSPDPGAVIDSGAWGALELRRAVSTTRASGGGR